MLRFGLVSSVSIVNIVSIISPQEYLGSNSGKAVFLLNRPVPSSLDKDRQVVLRVPRLPQIAAGAAMVAQ